MKSKIPPQKGGGKRLKNTATFPSLSRNKQISWLYSGKPNDIAYGSNIQIYSKSLLSSS